MHIEFQTDVEIAKFGKACRLTLDGSVDFVWPISDKPVNFAYPSVVCTVLLPRSAVAREILYTKCLLLLPAN